MLKIVIGLILWTGAHLLRRAAPNLRRDMTTALGDGLSKGLVSLVLIGAVYLLFSGFRTADLVELYPTPPLAGHVNNLLMLAASFTFGIGIAGGRLCARVRHPMLWGVILWAFAHLLVNGDLASVLLFGGLGIWAGLEIHLINLSEGPWERPMPGNAVQDWKLALAALFAYFFIAGIHWLFDKNPFLGSYS